MAEIDALKRPSFDPADNQRDQVLRESFRSHFPRTYRSVQKLEALWANDDQEQTKLLQKVTNQASVLEARHGIQFETARAVLWKAAQGQLGTSPQPMAPPGPFTIQDVPTLGLVLFLGGSGIASSRGPNARQDLAQAETEFVSAAALVPTWPETRAARVARTALLAEKVAVRQQLVEIVHRHSLPNMCRLCAPP
jgi:hypothetical protein